MPKPVAAALSIVLCAVLLAACGDSGSTPSTTATATVPSGTLGAAGSMSSATYDMLVRGDTALKAKVQRSYEGLEHCDTKPSSERRWTCRSSLGHLAREALAAAADELLRYEAHGQDAGECRSGLRAYGFTLAEAGRAFGVIHSAAQAVLSGQGPEHYDKAIAALPPAYEKVASSTIPASCRP